MSLDVLIQSGPSSLGTKQKPSLLPGLDEVAAGADQPSFADISQSLMGQDQKAPEASAAVADKAENTPGNIAKTEAREDVSIDAELASPASEQTVLNLSGQGNGLQATELKPNSSNIVAGIADPVLSAAPLLSVSGMVSGDKPADANTSRISADLVQGNTAAAVGISPAPVSADILNASESFNIAGADGSTRALSMPPISQAVMAPVADAQNAGEAKIADTRLPASGNAINGNPLPSGGELLPQSGLKTEDSFQLASQSLQALSPQLAPQLRQWLHQALSGLASGPGEDPLSASIDSAIEAGTDPEGASLLRHSDLLSKPSETGLPKAPMTGPSGDDWQQLVERMRLWQQPRLQQVEMTMNQEQLGRMQLQVQVHEGAIRVQFAAGQAATQEWLAQQLPGLQSELEASGLKVDSTRVSEWVGADSEQSRAGSDARDPDGRQLTDAGADVEPVAIDSDAAGEDGGQNRALANAGMSVFA